MNTWPLAVAIIVAVIGVVAVKIDMAAVMDRRNDARRAKMRYVCPHVRLYKTSKDIIVESLAVSPPLTLSWYCKMCGCQFWSEPDGDQAYWATRYDEWKRHFDKAERLRRRIR